MAFLKSKTSEKKKNEEMQKDASSHEGESSKSADVPKGVKITATYPVVSDNVEARITIYFDPREYVPLYQVEYPKLTLATHILLDRVKEELILMVPISTKEFIDPNALTDVKEKFMAKAMELLDKHIPHITMEEKELLTGHLIHEMVGLGDLEILLQDAELEEIVINNSREALWVYHKKYGWLKTNIVLKDEEQIYTYSSAIGRRVGRQITNLDPLMDAHLTTGDRVNATLFPISTKGNTITIRKFARNPWTIVHFIEAKTISKEVAALLWLAIQYELNILIAGGTASGKTAMLNVLAPFMPPNQRIISIEDTREINLPKFLHWVPFSSREANPEGKGQISMLDLLVNSLRMRPDRIILGEVRRKEEAEVMFEAIRTGHSAYATFHADKAEEVYKRLTNPPMNLPESVLSALHLIVVQYRHRRIGMRRTLEVAEIVPGEGKNLLNVLYRWNPKEDTLEEVGRLHRVAEELNLYTGMSSIEIHEDIQNKIKILEWLIKQKIKTVDAVGKIMAEYYADEKKILEFASKNKSPAELLGPRLMEEIAKSASVV